MIKAGQVIILRVGMYASNNVRMYGLSVNNSGLRWHPHLFWGQGRALDHHTNADLSGILN